MTKTEETDTGKQPDDGDPGSWGNQKGGEASTHPKKTHIPAPEDLATTTNAPGSWGNQKGGPPT